MAQEILVEEQIEAGEELAREFSEKFPLSVAFWLSPIDTELWYLHLASPSINDASTGAAYAEILRIAQAPRFAWLNPFQIKVISSQDRLAVDAAKIRGRFPAQSPIKFNETYLGGISVNGAYFYPVISAANSAP